MGMAERVAVDRMQRIAAVELSQQLRKVDKLLQHDHRELSVHGYKTASVIQSPLRRVGRGELSSVMNNQTPTPTVVSDSDSLESPSLGGRKDAW